MTADIRDRLRKLTEAHAAATPGPWAQHPADGWYVIGEVSVDGMEYLDVADCGGRDPGYPTSADADAALIVASVNAVPWLVAALTAVLDLANELDQSHDSADVAASLRAVVAAAGDQP